MARFGSNRYKRTVVVSRQYVSDRDSTDIEHLQVDITYPGAARKVLHSVQPNTLVMSAAIGNYNAPEDVLHEQISLMTATNFSAQINWLTVALQELPRWSAIGWLSSLTAWIPDDHWAVYGATKAGVEQFIRSVRPAFEKRNISITVCYPGAVATRFHDDAGGVTPVSAAPATSIAEPMLEAIEERQTVWAAPMDREFICSLTQIAENVLKLGRNLLK